MRLSYYRAKRELDSAVLTNRAPEEYVYVYVCPLEMRSANDFVMLQR